MEYNIINSLKDGERISSTYADLYFDDEHCDYEKPLSAEVKVETVLKPKDDVDEDDLWVSPSDFLIGILELTPPFTSKITRGVTHEGILGIGNEILQTERALFVEKLSELIHENDAAWRHVLQYETAIVTKQVQKLYANIYKEKTKIMNEEISAFYEHSLHELENHLKSQVEETKISAHGSIVSKLNDEIKEKLEKERVILETILQKKYDTEVSKMKDYYTLLLSNEVERNSLWIHRALTERNDALKAFYRQVEAENTTSTMYMLCTERKKCRIKKFIMNNYQNLELKEKYQKIKERQDIINIFREREVRISQINNEWEEKIKKILQLFLKFISFSLKLLPEQTTFLLNFEKMVVLQLNEIQKMPNEAPTILVDSDSFMNEFHFETKEEKYEECEKEPFILVGDLTVTPPPKYGSRETLPDDVDLPVVRLQRQFVYAKCHGYEDIKAMLEAERCKCSDFPKALVSTEKYKEPVKESSVLAAQSDSSFESLFLDEIHRLNDCPVSKCRDWLKQCTFPQLNDYLDFDDEKYERVKTILSKLPKKRSSPVFLDPKDITRKELPFAATKEPYHNVSTQYSSQEDLYESDQKCSCNFKFPVVHKESTVKIQKSPSKTLLEIMDKRRTSLRCLLQQNPDLLKMFTDESFDFQF